MNEIPHPNITRLVVKNYRSLLDVDVILRPLTVLVGENGSGKSNLIDVLRFVRDALSRSLEEAVLMRGGMSAIRCWFADEGEAISIHLYFEGPEWAGEYGFAFDSSHDKIEVLSEQFSVASTVSDSTSLSFEVTNGQLVKEIKISDPKPRSHAPDKHSLYLPIVASDCPTVFGVCDFLAKMSFYDLKPDTLRQPQPPRSPFPLWETGQNLASTLLELQKREEDYLITEALDVIADGLTGYNVEQVNGHLITKLHYTFTNGTPWGAKAGHDHRFGHKRTISSQLRDEADGTIQLLALLAALYQHRSASPLIVEKPEKEIYSRKLGLCSGVLSEARLRYQVLVTTHSPDLIDGFPVDSFLVVEKEAVPYGAITKIGPLVEDQRKAVNEKLFSLGELMQIEGLQREGGSLQAKI